METIDTNTTFDSPLFHALTRDAVNRCNGKGDFDAITAIILSCTSLEAFLNELAQYACTEAKGDRLFEVLGDSLKNAVDEWKSPLEKYDKAWAILHGDSINKGQGVRQKLKTLFDLRNGLVHAKAEETSIVIDPSVESPEGFDVGVWLGQIRELYCLPKFVKALQSDGIVEKEPQDERWVNRICDKRVAEWAFKLVAAAAEQLISPLQLKTDFYQRLMEQSLAGYEARKSKHA